MSMLVSELLGLIGIAIVVATLPLLIEILVLSVAALWPSGNRVDRESGSWLAPVTVLVPAHNEQTLIGRCVRSVLGAGVSGVDVLVVAHNCTDATAERAKSAGARVLVLNDPGQTGKGCALRYGFAAVLPGPPHGVLVIDADSVVDRGLVERVRRRLLAGVGAMQCRYEIASSPDRPGTRLTNLAIHAFNVIRPRGRARLGLSAGILGNGFALHREVLKRIPYDAQSIVEDLEYHLSLVRAGIRVEFIDAVAVHGEMSVSSQSAKAQRARWEGGRLLLMKQWAPRLIADVLRGRIRLMEPLLDLLSLPMSSAATLLLVAACLPVGWIRLYVLGAFTVLLFHVAVAAVSGPGLWGTMRALSTVPGYIFWKIWIFPEIWRSSRANAAWVRTERESTADTP